MSWPSRRVYPARWGSFEVWDAVAKARVMGGRAVIKMTPDEFFSLLIVAYLAAADLRRPPAQDHGIEGH